MVAFWQETGYFESEDYGYPELGDASPIGIWNDLILDSAGTIELNADLGDITFADGAVDIITITPANFAFSNAADATIKIVQSPSLLCISKSMYSRSKISFFVKNMPVRDSLALRKFLDNQEPGVVMKGDLRCNSCFEESEVDLPIGPSFFWPET